MSKRWKRRREKRPGGKPICTICGVAIPGAMWVWMDDDYEIRQNVPRHTRHGGRTIGWDFEVVVRQVRGWVRVGVARSLADAKKLAREHNTQEV